MSVTVVVAVETYAFVTLETDVAVAVVVRVVGSPFTTTVWT